MNNEERYIPIYCDKSCGEQMSGIFTYENLLEEYNNEIELTNGLWERAFPIPDDKEVKTFTDHYCNGMVDTYTISFKEVKDACGLYEAIEYWYGLLRGC